MLGHFGSEIRLAQRRIFRDRSTSLSIILMLTILTGIVVSFATVIYSAAIRALPYRNPEDLLAIYSTHQRFAGQGIRVSLADFTYFRNELRSFSDIAAYMPESLDWRQGTVVESVRAARASVNFLGLLGIVPRLGRGFVEGDALDAAEQVVLISAGTYRSRFGGAPDIVGKTVYLNDQGFQIIGVLPDNFRYNLLAGRRVEFFLPMTQGMIERSPRIQRGAELIGRLRHSSSVQGAQRELDALTARLAEQYPEDRGFGALVRGLHEDRFGHLEFPIAVISGGLLLTLLIACCNAAASLISRAGTRIHEAAIRRALGGSRWSLFRQELVYSTSLAMPEV